MEQEKKLPIGFLVKRLDRTIGRYFESIAKDKGLDEVTITHGRILAFLSERKGEEIYQKDLEKTLCINRSSVTTILQLMEKKGYIERISSKNDQRLKQVVITPLGEQKHLETIECFKILESIIEETLSKEQCDEMSKLLIEMTDKLREKERRNSVC